MIPFSPPYIDEDAIQAVVETLRSGWITTGPRTKQFEKEISSYCGAQATLCLNSATAGLELMLRWFGVGPGDEVILPAYTYSATANVVVHCGAKPVFVDIRSIDFNIDAEAVSAAINEHTKVIMPVDFGGLPADYRSIMKLVQRNDIRAMFKAGNEQQKKLGRIMVLSDAAHSFGARWGTKRTGALADSSVFSFHAVKNLTTAEGGAICLQLPHPFDAEEEYRRLNIFSLHGQNKDALAKMQKGNWKYDIVEAGYKCNMTDIAAAIGLVQLRKYDAVILPSRQAICHRYATELAIYPWAELPLRYHRTEDELISSSDHLFALRIKGISEQQRDEVIRLLAEQDIAVNVHFLPVPGTSFYRKMGYNMNDYPVAQDAYSREISLPVYFTLSSEQQGMVIRALTEAVELVRNSR
jgi:dTDP-4-amino-4,6-dideoxygalactose transaminase